MGRQPGFIHGNRKVDWEDVDFEQLRDVDIAEKYGVTRQAANHARQRIAGNIQCKFKNKQKQSISLLKEGKAFTSKELAKNLKMSRNTAANLLSRNGLLERVQPRIPLVTSKTLKKIKELSGLSIRETAKLLDIKYNSFVALFYAKGDEARINIQKEKEILKVFKKLEKKHGVYKVAE